MTRVLGIGAVMIYAKDPDKLAHWYASRLGIESSLDESDNCYYGEVVDPDGNAGPVFFGIYPDEGRARANNNSLMVNYRVDNFPAFLKKLKDEGEEITRTVNDGNGQFAYFSDPEGNPIEIWQPPR